MVKPSILQESSPESHPSVEVGSVVESESVWQAGEAAPAQPAHPTYSDIPGKGVPESVLDVALGLVLNEIAHQARSITNATGSAVLLVRGGVPVCRSISGATARDVSTYLSECSVCADLSWRNGASQNCHDVETDSRFDPPSCRRLGLRSFASVPIQDDNKAVVAIVQTFSSRPEAFSDRDILALKGLGSHIVGHTEAASRTFRSIPNTVGKVTRETTPAEKPPSRFGQRFHFPKVAIVHERLNLGLGMSIIFLALLLGWTIGRSEREAAHQSKEASLAPVVDRPQNAALPAKPDSSGDVQSTHQTIASDVPPVSVPEVERKSSQLPNRESNSNHEKQRHSLVSTPAHSDTSSGGLVIFESGTQVFPTKSLRSLTPSDPRSKDESKSGQPKSSDQGTPVTISEDVAEQQLLRRVEPEYTESAREQRLQGKVVLNVRVGKDGTVRSLSRVGGDPQLAILAAKAVQQWKFAPLVREDRPVSFESQVTLSFELP
jgi:TonB family protein